MSNWDKVRLSIVLFVFALGMKILPLNKETDDFVEAMGKVAVKAG